MASGDDMVCGRDNRADEGTTLTLDLNSPNPNPNNFLLQVDGQGTEIGILGVGEDGVRGIGAIAGVRGIATGEGSGIVGQGSGEGSGIVGQANRYGVLGLLPAASIPFCLRSSL